MMKIHFLQKWEDALPEWMGEAKYQGVCWIYAIWQIFRTNAFLLLCISYIPFLIRKLIWKWKNQQPKTVIAVVQGSGRFYSDDAAWTRFRFNLPPSLNIVPHPLSGILLEGWEVVKYKSLYYIVHNISLASIRIVHTLWNGNVIYVKNHLPVNATKAVGMEISEEEAFQLVFSGEYGCLYGIGMDSMECLPTWLNYMDINTKIWGVLSSFPTLLQAANFNRLSFSLSLCIMVLDINRHIIYKVYDRIFLAIATFVKEMVFRNHTGMYHFFSMFSSRWKYTDPLLQHCYRLRPDDTFFLHPNSRLKSLEDVVCIPRTQLETTDPQESDQQSRREKFYRELLELEDVNSVVEGNTKVGIRVWWEEKFSLRVPFISFTKVLLPRCLRDYLSYQEGYRAFGCTTFIVPFDVTARIRGKSILVE